MDDFNDLNGLNDLNEQMTNVRCEMGNDQWPILAPFSSF
jgi:hypothetical protein